MRNLVTWATAGLFLLSLQGNALAQKEEKAPPAAPPAVETSAPIAPAEKVAAPKKAQKKTKKTTTKKGKKTKGKKTKKAKKKAPKTE